MEASTSRALVESLVEQARKHEREEEDGSQEEETPLGSVLEAMDHVTDWALVHCESVQPPGVEEHVGKPSLKDIQRLEEMVELVEAHSRDFEEECWACEMDKASPSEPKQSASERRSPEGTKEADDESSRHEPASSSLKSTVDRTFSLFLEEATEDVVKDEFPTGGELSDDAPASDPGEIFELSDEGEHLGSFSLQDCHLGRTVRRLRSSLKLKSANGDNNTVSAPSTPPRAPIPRARKHSKNKELAQIVSTIQSAWQVLRVICVQADMMMENDEFEECISICTEGIRMANHLRRQTLPPEDEIGFTASSLRRLLGKLFRSRASCHLGLAHKRKEAQQKAVQSYRSIPCFWELASWLEASDRQPDQFPMLNNPGKKSPISRHQSSLTHAGQIRQHYQRAVEDAVASISLARQAQAYLVLGDSLTGLEDVAGAFLAYLKGLSLTSGDVEDDTQEELYSRLLSSKVDTFAFENFTMWDRCSWWPLSVHPTDYPAEKQAWRQVLHLLHQGVK